MSIPPTLHIINWKNEDRELTRADVPLWLMRFSYSSPGAFRVLVWVE